MTGVPRPGGPDPRQFPAGAARRMKPENQIAALQVGEVAYADLPAKVLSSPDCVHRIERMRTGYDHAALGATVNPAEIPDGRFVAWLGLRCDFRSYRGFGAVSQLGSLISISPGHFLFDQFIGELIKKPVDNN